MEAEILSRRRRLSAAAKSSNDLKTVSIIIPVYNEYIHVSQVIERVLAAPMPEGVQKEVIVIDDGSTDGTTEILKQLDSTLVKVHHSVLNFGKGTAIRKGLEHATGNIVVIQDGDQEYDPNEIQKLLVPILEGKARVVYGSRFSGPVKGMRLRYRLVNKLLVWAVQLFYGVRLTDEATAYKAFDRRLLDDFALNCERFEFCPEVTAKIIRRGVAIHEVPISYRARTLKEGKKIRFWDAVDAFWTLLRYRFWR